MKRTFSSVFSFLILLLFPIISYSQVIEWQTSTAVIDSNAGSSIELGIRNKICGSCAHIVKFIITDPNGKEYRIEKKLADNNFVKAIFPQDFRGADVKLSGVYSFKGFAGKLLLGEGQFKFSGQNAEIISRF